MRMAMVGYRPALAWLMRLLPVPPLLALRHEMRSHCWRSKLAAGGWHMPMAMAHLT